MRNECQHQNPNTPKSEEAMMAAATLAEKAGKTGACAFSKESVIRLWKEKGL
jgi:hypothetical protein